MGNYIRIGAAIALLLSAALIVAGADAATELAARRVGPTAPTTVA